MYTKYHSLYAAQRVLLQGVDDAAIAQSTSTAHIDLLPHQTWAALFALRPPLSRGAFLADEVGLGKTVEAGLVIAQFRALGLCRILVIAPASIRTQWQQEMRQKFAIDVDIVDDKMYRRFIKEKNGPIARPKVMLMSYEYAANRSNFLSSIPWDLVIFDEAHALRNVSRGPHSRRAKRLKQALRGRFKILLSATPLQNSLAELHGVVSVIDEQFLGDEKTFLSMFRDHKNVSTIRILHTALSKIFVRNLRRQVQQSGHVNFVNRNVINVRYTPSDHELLIYEAISWYVNKRSTVGIKQAVKRLYLANALKICGSSIAAAGKMLQSLRGRLEMLLAQEKGSNFLDDDRFDDADAGSADDADECAEDLETHLRNDFQVEIERDEMRRNRIPIDRVVLLISEIETIRKCQRLVRSIKKDSKCDALIAYLPTLLNEVARKGAERKIVIFTEYLATQKYLAQRLSDAGYAGRIVTLNGTNQDEESARHFETWLQDAGDGVESRDRPVHVKTAIIAAFRSPEATILIATRSGEEGINLQFCSAAVSVDLPWNPQRLEQRIGRLHRLGQRIDIIIVNCLMNENAGETKVYQKLMEKLELFKAVFGASDDAMGVCSPSAEFNDELFGALDKTRSVTAVQKDSARLTDELASSMAAELDDARLEMAAEMDPALVESLTAHSAEMRRQSEALGLYLLIVVRAELPEARFHSNTDRFYDYNGRTWRVRDLGDDSLTRVLVDQAARYELPPGHVRFVYEGPSVEIGVAAKIDPLVGRSGWMRVSRMTFETPAEARRSPSAFVSAILTDDGEELSAEVVEQLFVMPGEYLGAPNTQAPIKYLAAIEQKQKGQLLHEAGQRHADVIAEAAGRLGAQKSQADKLDTKKKTSIRAKIRTAKNRLNKTSESDHASIASLRKTIDILETQLATLMLSTLKNRNERQAQMNEAQAQQTAALIMSPRIEHVLTVRWELSSKK